MDRKDLWELQDDTILELLKHYGETNSSNFTFGIRGYAFKIISKNILKQKIEYIFYSEDYITEEFMRNCIVDLLYLLIKYNTWNINKIEC